MGLASSMRTQQASRPWRLFKMGRYWVASCITSRHLLAQERSCLIPCGLAFWQLHPLACHKAVLSGDIVHIGTAGCSKGHAPSGF